MNPPSDFRRYFPYALILAAYAAGMWLDVMEIDAAQYASMGRNMMRSGDYLHLYDHRHGYLDKPPLVFWMSALSFKLFGVSNWAYKLPSVLFSLLAIYGTQRLGSLLHTRAIGALAGLILASTQAFFLMNNDVKTDMYLIGPMMMGIWLLAEWARGGRLRMLLLGSIFLGVGMLAKGPLALIAPVMAIGSDVLLRRDWAMLRKWGWLLVIPIALLVTTPFLIGQYQQYGTHGIRFFLWTQSFGRVTGQSEWSNNATAFFFVHSFAWSFLPWTAIFLRGLVHQCSLIVRSGLILPKRSEGISIAGFLLVFVALCFSKFKLPHYIFVTYPFAAILTASFLVELRENLQLQAWAKALLILQRSFWFLAVALVSLLAFWAFPENGLFLKIAFLLVATVISVDMFRNKEPWVRWLWPTALGFAMCNLMLNLHLYPAVLQYQSSAQAGKYMSALDPPTPIFAFTVSGRALDFYAPSNALPVPNPRAFKPMLHKSDLIVYTNDDGLKKIQQRKIQFEVLKTFPHNPPTRMSLMFLNPATRAQVVKARYLLHMPRQRLLR
jgi:4-amino-4-deoxy-L-arabinose transferase-like glycosyltransferase